MRTILFAVLLALAAVPAHSKGGGFHPSGTHSYSSGSHYSATPHFSAPEMHTTPRATSAPSSTFRSSSPSSFGRTGSSAFSSPFGYRPFWYARSNQNTQPSLIAASTSAASTPVPFGDTGGDGASAAVVGIIAVVLIGAIVLVRTNGF